jgi:signal transduction histidine kinase
MSTADITPFSPGVGVLTPTPHTATNVTSVAAATTPSAQDLLAAISRAHRLYFRDVAKSELFGQMLNDILDLTGCDYGFIGEVLLDAHSQPYLKTWALTDIAWDEPTRELYAQTLGPDGGLNFTNLDTLFGRVLTSQAVLIANEPATDPRRGGLPEGHPPMHSFLGVPLMRGPEMVGMVGVANRQGGFTSSDAEFLAPYLELCAHLIDVIRSDHERSAAQAAERAARELAERQERLSLIGRLASGVAHDMNNLITVVSIQCELLEMDDHLSGDARQGVSRIKEVCETASAMAQRLNGLRARTPGPTVRCHPREILNSTTDVLAAIAGDSMKVAMRLHPSLTSDHEVRLSDSDLLQIMMNLISNSRDANDGEGRISVDVSVSRDGDHEVVKIRVTDDGPGVEESVRETLFDPFISSKGPGRGLGLPTVRTLVDMAGGRVVLHDSCSDPEPAGTTFEITLPLLA